MGPHHAATSLVIVKREREIVTVIATAMVHWSVEATIVLGADLAAAMTVARNHVSVESNMC